MCATCVISTDKRPDETWKIPRYHIVLSQIFIKYTLEVILQKFAKAKGPRLVLVSGRGCVLAGIKGGACESIYFLFTFAFLTDALTPADLKLIFLDLSYQKVLKLGLNFVPHMCNLSMKRLCFYFPYS